MSSPQTLLEQANCFACHASTPYMLDMLEVAFWARILDAGGIEANLVPDGSVYGGGGTFTLNVSALSCYRITWGANDVSVELPISNQIFVSAGVGTSVLIWTYTDTTMIFTGTVAGTTVTVSVKPCPTGSIPVPTGFTLTTDSDGLGATAGWDAPPVGVVETEIWVSADNITYTLESSVAAPATSGPVTLPAVGAYKYVKIRWCSATTCGPWTSPLAIGGRTANWVTRVIANGGAAPSAATRAAVDIYDRGLIDAGIDTKIYVLNFFAPDNLIASLTPFIVGTGSDPWTNGGPFVAGDLNTYGLKGNGATKYLRTGLIANTLSHTNHGFAVMTADASVNFASSAEIGSNSGVNAYGLYTNDAYRGLFDSPNSGGTGRATMTGASSGYYAGFRNATNNAVLYFANRWNAHSLETTNSNVTASALAADNIGVFCRNTGANTPSAFSAKRIAMAAVTQFFTATESSDLYDLTLTLRDSFADGTLDDADNWAKRIVMNGGAAPAAASIAAVRTFLAALNSAGVLTKFESILAYAPDNLTAAVTPVWRKTGADPWTFTSVPFVAGDLTVNGLAGGANKGLKSGVRMDDIIDGASLSFIVYVSVTVNEGNIDIGANGSGGNPQYQIFVQSANTLGFDSPFGGGTGRASVANTQAGYFAGVRSALNRSDIYKARSDFAHASVANNTNAVADQTGSTNEVYGHCLNNSSADGTQHSTKRISLLGIATELTTAESLAVFNAVQAMRTSFGGGFV